MCVLSEGGSFPEGMSIIPTTTTKKLVSPDLTMEVRSSKGQITPNITPKPPPPPDTSSSTTITTTPTISSSPSPSQPQPSRITEEHHLLGIENINVLKLQGIIHSRTQDSSTIIEVPVMILVDSGATTNFVSSKLVDRMKLYTTPLKHQSIVKLANGTTTEITKEMDTKITMNTFVDEGKLTVVELDTYDVVLGMKFLQKYNNKMKIDWKEGSISITTVKGGTEKTFCLQSKQQSERVQQIKNKHKKKKKDTEQQLTMISAEQLRKEARDDNIESICVVKINWCEGIGNKPTVGDIEQINLVQEGEEENGTSNELIKLRADLVEDIW